MTPVNDAPVAVSQDVATVEDTAVAIELTGIDVDGEALTFSVVTAPASGSLTGSAPNLTYTPNSNFSGSDSFTFTVADGSAVSTPTTVVITVTAVNDGPTALDDTAPTVQGTAVTIPVVANDVDIDGDALVVVAVTQGTQGVVRTARLPTTSSAPSSTRCKRSRRVAAWIRPRPSRSWRKPG